MQELSVKYSVPCAFKDFFYTNLLPNPSSLCLCNPSPAEVIVVRQDKHSSVNRIVLYGPIEANYRPPPPVIKRRVVLVSRDRSPENLLFL